MERLDLKKVKTSDLDSGLLGTFGTKALDLEEDAAVRPEKRLQARMLAEMISIDQRRAVTSMKAWAKFVRFASQTRAAPFETLAEYIPARVIDAGEL